MENEAVMAKREQARRMAVELDQLHARIFSIIDDNDHDTIEGAAKALFRACCAKKEPDPVVVNAEKIAEALKPWIAEAGDDLNKTERQVLEAAFLVLKFIGNYGMKQKRREKAAKKKSKAAA